MNPEPHAYFLHKGFLSFFLAIFCRVTSSSFFFRWDSIDVIATMWRSLRSSTKSRAKYRGTGEIVSRWNVPNRKCCAQPRDCYTTSPPNVFASDRNGKIQEAILSTLSEPFICRIIWENYWVGNWVIVDFVTRWYWQNPQLLSCQPNKSIGRK